MIEFGNQFITKRVCSKDCQTGNRPRDGRAWLPGHAPLVMTGCEAPGTTYLQGRLPSRWGLARILKANNGELAINLVSKQGRKVVIRPAKRQADCGRHSCLAVHPSFAQPGKSECLRGSNKVNHAEHGKPDESHLQNELSGIPTVRKGEGSAGKGTKKKRMPSCNEMDRGYYNERISCNGKYPT